MSVYTQYDMDKAKERAFMEGYRAAVADDIRLLTRDRYGDPVPGPSRADAEIMAREAGWRPGDLANINGLTPDPYNLTSPDGGHNER